MSPARLPIAGRAGIRDAAERAVPPVQQHDAGPGAQAPASPPGLPKYLSTRGSGRPTRITVDLVADLHGFLRGYAQARDAAAADIVRELIRQLKADPDLSSRVTAEVERRREALAEAMQAAREQPEAREVLTELNYPVMKTEIPSAEQPYAVSFGASPTESGAYDDLLPARVPMAGRAGNRDAALRAVPAERAVPPVLQRDPGPRAQTPASPPGLPKYLRLERKELLIWPDQVTDLSILARGLNRNRRRAGERITTNTLIRVAVALLLSRSQDLAGTTEEELRRSLGLED